MRVFWYGYEFRESLGLLIAPMLIDSVREGGKGRGDGLGKVVYSGMVGEHLP